MFTEELRTRRVVVACGNQACAMYGVPHDVDLAVNYPASIMCGPCGTDIPAPPAEDVTAE